MNSFSRLLWTLNSKKIEIKDYFEGEANKSPYIKFYIHCSEVEGFTELFERLDAVYGGILDFNLISENDSKVLCELYFKIGHGDAQRLENSITVIENAIAKDEYKVPRFNDKGSHLDVKLGISCNNNCLHCVIKPNVYEIQNRHPKDVVIDSGVGMQCSFDLKFEQVIDIITKKSSNINRVILTGGEPTIRKDIVPILKWLYYNRPGIIVSFQTNGRNLSDRNLVNAIRRFSRKIDFAVAIHGMEDTHNKIVNNRKEKGNPFKETVEGMKNLLELFPKKSVRSEMVLSNYNIDEIMDSVRFQHEEFGVQVIGISYPHLVGFEPDVVTKTAPPMDKVLVLLKELNDYAKGKDSLLLIIEEVPACFYNQLGDSISIRSFGFFKNNISVNFMGSQNDDFAACWASEHAKFSQCEKCVLNDKCVGTWTETRNLNEPFVKPIEKLAPELVEFLKRHKWEVAFD